MTRVVGTKDRTEFILDPAAALRAGAVLDRMLAGALPRRPRGVVRGSHEALNRLDDQRLVEAARRINAAR